jgi:hypothetical protein
MEVHNFHTKSLVAVQCACNLDRIAFSPDSDLLAGANEKTICIFSGPGWKVRQYDQTKALTVALSPDGKWLARSGWYVRGRSSRVFLHNMLQGGAIHAYILVNNNVTRLAFSNDSCRLITEDETRAVETYCVLDRHAATPVLQACSRVHFDFGGEWIAYMARNIIWVPREFRGPHCHALHDHGFVWTDNESVQHVEFDPSLMNEAGGWPPAKSLYDEWKRFNPSTSPLEDMLFS